MMGSNYNTLGISQYFFQGVYLWHHLFKECKAIKNLDVTKPNNFICSAHDPPAIYFLKIFYAPIKILILQQYIKNDGNKQNIYND